MSFCCHNSSARRIGIPFKQEAIIFLSSEPTHAMIHISIGTRASIIRVMILTHFDDHILIRLTFRQNGIMELQLHSLMPIRRLNSVLKSAIGEKLMRRNKISYLNAAIPLCLWVITLCTITSEANRTQVSTVGLLMSSSHASVSHSFMKKKSSANFRGDIFMAIERTSLRHHSLTIFSFQFDLQNVDE